MKIQVKRINQDYLQVVTNEKGHKLVIDASKEVGGQNLGFRPMELMLSGIGGCSLIDVISILKKQRQKLQDISVEVTGERETGEPPNLFQHIKLHFTLYGKLEEGAVQRALALSMDKYCSVARILEKTATISYTYQIESELTSSPASS